jgi:hypothetical protein
LFILLSDLRSLIIRQSTWGSRLAAKILNSFAELPKLTDLAFNSMEILMPYYYKDFMSGYNVLTKLTFLNYKSYVIHGIDLFVTFFIVLILLVSFVFVLLFVLPSDMYMWLIFR